MNITEKKIEDIKELLKYSYVSLLICFLIIFVGVYFPEDPFLVMVGRVVGAVHLVLSVIISIIIIPCLLSLRDYKKELSQELKEILKK